MSASPIRPCFCASTRRKKGTYVVWDSLGISAASIAEDFMSSRLLLMLRSSVSGW
ncbi:Uncharacterised protein [Mycobacteroides abscessus subsp. abscessus]|nr:Uncharacterised protein [Mycobacteroides abscessus subsp. abscessus]